MLDNNQKGGDIPATVNGGGPADEMVRALGGNPDACFPRLQCRGVLALQPVGKEQYYKKIAGENPWGRLDYANNGVSDDFAQTFMYTILGTNSDSPLRIQWMESYLISLNK